MNNNSNNNSNKNCPYHEYYTIQAGTGIGPFFKGQFYQRGHGIGSFLRGIWRMAVPLIKKGARAVGSEALKSGSNFMNDVVENKPIKVFENPCKGGWKKS